MNGPAVEDLGVIGNISRDIAVYPGGVSIEMAGGAALYVALAATRAGLPAAPISVVGTDLARLMADRRAAALDLSHVQVSRGQSCTFRLAYDSAGQLTSTRASFGVAIDLTQHALSVVGSCNACHVCCRRPLDIKLILGKLTDAGTPFSLDFHLASAHTLMRAAGPALALATAVFVNVAEFAILNRVADLDNLQTVVVSDGPRPARVFQHGREVATVTPQFVAATEVTGAGDTLAGTFLAASADGMDPRDALREAVTAASGAVTGPTLAIPGTGG